jgi:hypothetical protein
MHYSDLRGRLRRVDRSPREEVEDDEAVLVRHEPV